MLVEQNTIEDLRISLPLVFADDVEIRMAVHPLDCASELELRRDGDFVLKTLVAELLQHIHDGFSEKLGAAVQAVEKQMKEML